MTTKDSILALAAKISNGTVPNVVTDAQALAELTKAMCGSAPTEPIATVDDAIAYITANYSGGGGGVDVGALVPVLVNFDEPTVGSGGIIGGADGPHTVAIGDTVIGSGIISGLGQGFLFGSFAAGMTAQTMSYDANALSAYACTIGDDGESGTVYLTVEPYALEATRTSGDSGYSWTFVIPEMEEGVVLVLYPHAAD